MASFLYRLGRLAYRRRWMFVSIWTVLLLAIGVSAAAFMGTLSNTFTIPGTETQRTLDKLKAEMPEFAGGTGSIVYRTADGKAFTPEQEAQIGTALDNLAKLPDVAEVRNPFELQKTMDDAGTKLDTARADLAAGQKKLDEGKAQLADGRQQIKDGRKQITDGRAELKDAAAKLASGREQLDAGKTRLADGRAQLAPGKAQLASGRADLAAGQKKWNAGNAAYKAGAAKVADGRTQIATAKKDLATQAKKLDAGVAAQAAGMKQLLGGKSRAAFESGLARGLTELKQLPGLESQLKSLDTTIAGLKSTIKDLEQQAAAGKDVAAQLAGARAGLKEAEAGQVKASAGVKTLRELKTNVDAGTAALKQLDESKVKLDAGAAALAAGKKTLAGKEAQLDAAAAKLPGAKREIDSGAAALRTAESKLATASAQITTAQRKLDDAAAAITLNEAALVKGESEVAANTKKLDAAQVKLDDAEAKLPQAEADLNKGIAKLADGQQQLELGVRTADSTKGMRFVSQDGTTAAVHVTFVGSTDAISTDTRTQIQEIANAPEAAGVKVFYSKEIVQDLSSIFGIAEIVGLAIAAVVLLVMLGTLVAAGLPLVMAVLGVGAGVGGTLALSSVIEMASITPALALMLGLAVGIDYSLFIVHRHRRQLLEGMEMQESIGRATGTSGNAVVFAGLTVVIALSALAVPGLPFLTVLGLSAAFTVAMAVALAITLTPAALGIIGTRLISKRAWARAANPTHLATKTRNADGRHGWGAVVTRRPWLVAAASIVLLGVVAIPAAQLRTALPDGSAEPQESSAYQAYDDISTAFGAGYNGPLLILADLPAGLDSSAAQLANLDVADKLRAVPGVVAAVPVAVNEANNLGVLQVIPASGPASIETEQLVHTLRDSTGEIEAATGSTIAVTGQVAAQIDVSEKLAEALPPYLGIVVGLSLILLLLVFRSVVVPLLATAGFLLSLAAAFGATVAVYQWGWLGPIFDVNVPGPIMSFLPILLTGILFGLAMDYQVFLVSGMREAFVHGGNARAAVKAGFAHSAPVVTAAALIMASVFAGFVFSHLTMIRAIGFALAVGVLFDAFIVRMTLTPAIMHLLGEKAWYLPRWLDKILPDVDVEGAKLDTAAAGTAGPDTAPTPTLDPSGDGPGSGKATVDA